MQIATDATGRETITVVYEQNITINTVSGNK